MEASEKAVKSWIFATMAILMLGVGACDEKVILCDVQNKDRRATVDTLWNAWTECRLTCIDRGVFIEGFHTTEPSCWDACDVRRDVCREKIHDNSKT